MPSNQFLAIEPLVFAYNDFRLLFIHVYVFVFEGREGGESMVVCWIRASSHRTEEPGRVVSIPVLSCDARKGWS